MEVLFQIPTGSLPLQNGFFTKSQLFELAPYSTKTHEFHFYFPYSGKFNHFPAHAAKNEKIIAHCQPITFAVVDSPTTIDTTSWSYISQQAPKEELLEYLKKENVASVSLSSLAWRCKEKESYQAIISILKAKFVFESQLWRYSLFHQDLPTMKEYFAYCLLGSDIYGPFLNTPLAKTDPVKQRTIQHLEYWPLINERAHVFGKEKKIHNTSFVKQYNSLLNALQYKNGLSAQESISITYYLLLQDRVEEAKKMFEEAKQTRSKSKQSQEMDLQFDYMEAYFFLFNQIFFAFAETCLFRYFDFFNPTLTKAKEIVKKHENIKIKRWANLFKEIKQQIEEIEFGSRSVSIIDETNRESKQSQLAATEPSFDFSVENKQISISYHNLEEVTISYFIMDIEFMFSSNPFVTSNITQFSYIKPNSSEVVSLEKNQNIKTIALPKVNSSIYVTCTKGFRNSFKFNLLLFGDQSHISSFQTGIL